MFTTKRQRLAAETLLDILLLLILDFFTSQPLFGEQAIGTVKVSKQIDRVTSGGWVLTRVVIENNGTIPVFSIEVYEYFNMDFTLGGNVTIKHRDRSYLTHVSSSTDARTNQFIIFFSEPRILEPKEIVSFEYWTQASKSGDFQVPTSLVWFNYRYGASELRSSIYTNALLVHIPNEAERLVARVLPFIISGATFIITLAVLINLRKYLRRERI